MAFTGTTDMANELKVEFEWFLQNHDELVRKYNGKFVVIKGQTVIGDYSDQSQAVAETQQKGHALGSFLVQKVEPGNQAYTQVFHSRVA